MSDITTVWKFTLGLGREVLRMPIGAQVLHVGAQGSALTLWALVDPTHPTETRTFAIVGTGHPAPVGDHVGTVLDGPFVWHVFEARP